MILWAWKIHNLDSGEMQNLEFYKDCVGNVCATGAMHNQIFLNHGPVSTQMAQNVPQDEPIEAPKIGPRWVYIARRWPNIGSRWPNIGPKAAQHRPQRAQHRAKIDQYGPKRVQQQQLVGSN